MSFQKLIQIKKSKSDKDFLLFIDRLFDDDIQETVDFYRLVLHTFSEIDQNLITKKRTDQILTIFEKILENGVQNETDYSLLIKICSNLAKDYITKSFIPENPFDLSTESFIPENPFDLSKGFLMVEKLYSEMVSSNIEPHYRTYLYIFEMYAHLKKYKKTLFYFQKIREKWIKNEALETEYRLKDYKTLFMSLQNPLLIKNTTFSQEREVFEEIYWTVINNFTEDIEDPLDKDTFKALQLFLSKKRMKLKDTQIKTRTRQCKNCSVKIQSIELSVTRHKRLLDQIQGLVSHSFKNFIMKANYDCVIDAANIGYSRVENMAWKNRLNYEKIDSVIKHLRNYGWNPLIIIHKRHCSKKPEIAKFFNKWRGTGTSSSIFTTPYSSNDDWYWLYAILSKNREGLFVITNDEMRDHSFSFRECSSEVFKADFDRFRERHQTKFELKKIKNSIECKLKKPKPYSTRPQIVFPELTGCDEVEVLHIPVKNGEKINWYCSA